MKLNAFDMGVNIACMDALDQAEAEAVRKCKGVQPVWVFGR